MWLGLEADLFTREQSVPRRQLNEEYFGTQGWLGHFGEGANLCHLPGIEPRFLGHPALRLLAIETEM